VPQKIRARIIAGWLQVSRLAVLTPKVHLVKTRHSRAGGNPVPLFNMPWGLFRYAALFNLLDSRLRGNDGAKWISD
jgi:hypothetical protein